MRRNTLRLAISLVLLGSAGAARAGVDFGAPRPITSLAYTDAMPPLSPGGRGDLRPSITVGPSGTWIAAWTSSDITGPGDDPEAPEIVVSRSTDGGETWSAPSFLSDFTDDEDGVSSVATNGSGVWIVSWSHVGQPTSLQYSRSVDDGLSWSAAVTISTGGLPTSSVVASDGGTTWVIAMEIGDEEDAWFTRSTDDGVTWSPVAVLNTDAAVDAVSDYGVSLATDRAGNWVAVWDRIFIVAARSSDNGATWTAPQILGTGISGDLAEPALAYDGAGIWIASWVGSAPAGNTVHFVRSTDLGVTWSASAPVVSSSQDAGLLDRNATIVVPHGNQRWSLYWLTYGEAFGADEDILVSDSFDGGLSWDPPALANRNGRFDSKGEDDDEVAVASDGNGRTLLLWSSTDDLGGTIGSDVDILYAVSVDDCPSSPAAGCKTTTAGDSRLTIKDGPKGRDKLAWRWSKGQAVAEGDLGDPTTTSSYVLCLYAKAGASVVPVVEQDIEAAGTCKAVPCWSADGAGYRYRDSKTERGAMRSLALVPGADGQTSVDARAMGPFVGPPGLPLDLSSPARVQLINTETNACWEATFSSATVNDTVRFKATSN